MKNKTLLGNTLLLVTALIWGTAFVFQRSGMELIEPATFNAARMALSAVAVAIPAFMPRMRAARTTDLTEQKRCRLYTVVGGIVCGCFLSGGSVFQQMGLVYTAAGKAGFITALYMLLVPVMGFIVFRRRTTRLVCGAVLLGVIGMYLLCADSGLRLSRGDALVGVSAVFFSCHILSCDFFARRGDALKIAAIQFASTTLISVAVAAFGEKPTVQKLVSALVPILYCGLVSGGIGYTLQLVAQRYTEPAVASLLMSMESVFALIAGALLLGERMSLRELTGCGIMFLAIITVQLPALKAKASSEIH